MKSTSAQCIRNQLCEEIKVGSSKSNAFIEASCNQRELGLQSGYKRRLIFSRVYVSLTRCMAGYLDLTASTVLMTEVTIGGKYLLRSRLHESREGPKAANAPTAFATR